MLTAPATDYDRAATLGEIAHIVAEKPGPKAPRGTSPLTHEQRNQYENLVLMCNVHHELIDSQPNTWTVELLHQIKAEHEAWVQEQLDPEAPSSPTPVASVPLEVLGRDHYLTALLRSSDQRIEDRRLGAGLDPKQVHRSLDVRPDVPPALTTLAPGEARALVGPLGSGKSDVAEQWHRANITAAQQNQARPVPIWLTPESLDKTLEQQLLDEVGVGVLQTVGVDVVIDGLDEHPDRLAATVRQARDFVLRWTKSRVMVTSRALDNAPPITQLSVPLLDPVQAHHLMAVVAGHRIPPLDDRLQEAVRRPLFALLVAVHASDAEGATGIPELVDRVVDAVVTPGGHELYAELQRLAVETIRAGKPVDPERFATADVAARIRQSPLVTRIGRTCTFSLATFAQWFAAKAVAENVVDISAELTSLEAFERWKYVLAMVLAAGEPERADPVMAGLARWNPGAASWVVRETHSGGLTRARPDYTAEDWQAVGARLRFAAEAWLIGLGPLAEATFPVRFTGTTDLSAITLAVDLRPPHRMTLGWLLRNEIPGEPLGEVVRARNLSERTMVLRGYPITVTGLNWVWEMMRDLLAGDVGDNLADIALSVGSRHPGVVQQEVRDRLRRSSPELWAKLAPDAAQTAEPLYPEPDTAPSFTEPWGSYTQETMLRRSRAIAAAAMTCYLELAERLAPRFGDTLGVRGLMPVQFYGDVNYQEGSDEHDFPGPPEPGLAWLLRPIAHDPDGRDETANVVSLTLNDDDRDDELRDERDALSAWHYEQIRSRPAYEPFAPDFSVRFGRSDLSGELPATRIAVEWLWEDLRRLGWATGKIAPRL